jgi:hypothetical protein
MKQWRSDGQDYTWLEHDGLPPNDSRFSGGASIDRDRFRADGSSQKSDDLAGAKRRPLQAPVGRWLGRAYKLISYSAYQYDKAVFSYSPILEIWLLPNIAQLVASCANVGGFQVNLIVLGNPNQTVQNISQFITDILNLRLIVSTLVAIREIVALHYHHALGEIADLLGEFNHGCLNRPGTPLNVVKRHNNFPGHLNEVLECMWCGHCLPSYE